MNYLCEDTPILRILKIRFPLCTLLGGIAGLMTLPLFLRLQRNGGASNGLWGNVFPNTGN